MYLGALLDRHKTFGVMTAPNNLAKHEKTLFKSKARTTLSEPLTNMEGFGAVVVNSEEEQLKVVKNKKTGKKPTDVINVEPQSDFQSEIFETKSGKRLGNSFATPAVARAILMKTLDVIRKGENNDKMSISLNWALRIAMKEFQKRKEYKESAVGLREIFESELEQVENYINTHTPTLEKSSSKEIKDAKNAGSIIDQYFNLDNLSLTK